MHKKSIFSANLYIFSCIIVYLFVFLRLKYVYLCNFSGRTAI
nr:MAG TPA: hypothetical protein [Caudoviricetes sp.]